MTQEYFSVALTPDINLAIPLDNMGRVIQISIDSICTVPGVASFWYGAISFKGSLLWILDSDRYFQLNQEQKQQSRKLIAVIIQQQQGEKNNQLALVTPQLQGIIALKSEHLAELENDLTVTLNACCSAMTQDKDKRTFILNPPNLFQQLSEKSILVSA